MFAIYKVRMRRLGLGVFCAIIVFCHTTPLANRQSVYDISIENIRFVNSGNQALRNRVLDIVAG